MVDTSTIHKDMDVLGSDGISVGRVDAMEGARIKLERKTSPDEQHHYVDMSDVARVDEHVHLARPAAAILAAAGAGAGAATYASDHTVAAGEPRRNWLPWLLAGAGVIALLLALSRCNHEKPASDTTASGATETTTTTRVSGAPMADGSVAYQVDRYLGGSEAAPKTFAFQKLNFDSGKATIRNADESDLNDIARVFKAYPSARAAIVGYTDADGPAASNTKLGEERAKAVIAALAERGIDAGRFEARTGGENNPDASNANAAGKFENRRTELVILNR